MTPFTMVIVADQPLMRLTIVEAQWVFVMHERQPVERGA